MCYMTLIQTVIQTLVAAWSCRVTVSLTTEKLLLLQCGRWDGMFPSVFFVDNEVTDRF